MSDIKDIAARMVAQDNRITADPIFVVEQRKRVYGFDPDYASDVGIVWVYDDGDLDEVPADEAKPLEEVYRSTREEPEGYRRLAFQDTWEFVTACFTERGCEDYIAANRHNLKEPRIYVHSAYRNHEWRAIRQHLAETTAPNSTLSIDEVVEILARGEEFARRRQIYRGEQCHVEDLRRGRAEFLIDALIGLVMAGALATSPRDPNDR